MPAPKKDSVFGGGNTAKMDGRAQNGNRSGFRTDSAISNSRFGNERTLQPWTPDSNDAADGSLEKPSASGGQWDQFAENERLFGLKTDYDENIYTTSIDKSHPEYRSRVLAADKKAREIERSTASTAHVAEERVVDYVPGSGQGGENEEEKYSGVRRQEFPPLSGGRENRYTPPAKRAPTGQSSVKGAPIDPAIISSQIRAPPKKHLAAGSDQAKAPSPEPNKNGIAAKPESQKPAEPKPAEEKQAGGKKTPSAWESKTPEPKPAEKSGAQGQASAAVGRTTSSNAREEAPSATSTVERDVLNSFKSFATQQRQNAEKVRTSKAKADKEVKLTELKKFATSFKLSTPVPTDLVSIIAKDPAKQKEIQAKAIRNAEDIAKGKVEPTAKDKAIASKEPQGKTGEQNAAASSAPDARSSRAPTAPQASAPTAGPNRHAAPRQQFSQQQQYHGQPYRNNRGGAQHVPPQQQQTGTLAQRLRNVEQQKYSQPPSGHQHAAGPEVRAPPTGPSNSGDGSFNRRLSGVPGHMGAKLNPNSHEFRPSPFAASFSPNGHPSASSSPRSAANHVSETATPAAQGGQLIRRKTKAVDVGKCYILSHIKTIKPPQGRNWDDNGGIRPSYDTLPTWRQLQDDEKPDSTMHLTYKEHFERQPFAGPAMATPNPGHVVPQMPHQHQLPFHLQHGAHGMGPRQSPHMPPMQMHTPQHGHVQQAPYGNDDHRMMHSNSAQSFASPRMGQMQVAYPGMGSPAQVPYNQPVYMGHGNPQMAQFRSFSNTPHYAPHQQGQMGTPMMMQPQFMAGPQGMVAAPQMMYAGGHPQFMPQGGPPQPGHGANGYPSPGRPSAPVMVHQGSQQGLPMYGMSPNVQYNQPAYGPGQHNGPMSHARAYIGPGQQHYGTSPQHAHHYGSHHSSGSNSYNKGYTPQNHHQGPQANHSGSGTSAPQNRTTDGSDEAK